ncbi:unnamed protein product [Cuscuta campestris]|uniref:Zinc finger GRF-type domain-containing protein n=1 Tax=Cuscuta campestris TaxID=132261 RepID=A0A484MTR8_9ASTE|nr:unnamed protein product [Cuscuta campestris]
MAQNSFGSRSVTSSKRVCQYGEWFEVPTCRCGKDMKMLTSWTKSNPGIRFWTCAGNVGEGTRKCKSWDWIDPEICDRAKKIIPGLLDKINEKDREMEKLKNRNKQKKRMNVIPFMFGLGVGLVIHYLFLVLFM